MTIQELEKCITLYDKDIYSLCYHLTKDKQEADELYQDTFLEAVKKLEKINVKDNPKSYLLSIAIRLWKNKIRKIAWRNRIAPAYGYDQLLNSNLAVEDQSLTKLEQDEEKQILWKAIDELAYRTFKITPLIHGKTYNELNFNNLCEMNVSIKDKVQYQTFACDDLEIFANRGVDLAVTEYF